MNNTATATATATATDTATASHKSITCTTLELQCPSACESITAALRGLDPTTPVNVYERSVDQTSVAYVWYVGSELSMTAEEWLAS